MTFSTKINICDRKVWLIKYLRLVNNLQLSSFCCVGSLRQGALLISIVELSLTSFVLFLLLLGVTHTKDVVDLVASDLEQLEKNWSSDYLEGFSWYFLNNEKKMMTGQQLASLMLTLMYSGLIITIVHFISCLLLLYGTLRNLPQYLLPWTLTILFSIISGCFFVIILMIVPTPGCKFGTIMAGIALVSLEIYGWLVVFSYYLKLKQ